jgi:hypothetical protein
LLANMKPVADHLPDHLLLPCSSVPKRRRQVNANADSPAIPQQASEAEVQKDQL